MVYIIFKNSLVLFANFPQKINKQAAAQATKVNHSSQARMTVVHYKVEVFIIVVGVVLVLIPPSFLIASPQIRDASFRETVVLLLEHSRSGAAGLVINRVSELPLRDFVQIEGAELPAHIHAWNGGPTEQTKGIILHNRPTRTDFDNPGDVFALSATEGTLHKLIKASKPRAPNKNSLAVLYPYRFLIGCVGWHEGELDHQLQFGDWLQLALDQDLLFNTAVDDMWQHALSILGIVPARIIPLHQPWAH